MLICIFFREWELDDEVWLPIFLTHETEFYNAFLDFGDILEKLWKSRWVQVYFAGHAVVLETACA